MSEISVFLEASKETPNKLRWDGIIEGTKFEFYVPKSSVPRPWRHRIIITIGGLSRRRPSPSIQPSVEEYQLREIVRRVSCHSETVRFAPIGDPEDWEIGEPYIPQCLLPDPDIEYLEIAVAWDRSGGDWMIGRGRST